MCKYRFCTKSRIKVGLDSEFVNALNDATNIVAEYFAKRLVDLCRFVFAADRVPELGFNHAESGFVVAALMVVPHELVGVKSVIAPHCQP